MKIDQVVLYKQRYQGSKVAFNSRRGVGKIIKGIAVDIDSTLDIVILRDSDNFPHCVSIISLQEI
jgi:uncharacterized LabA/DUF88 family protein